MLPPAKLYWLFWAGFSQHGCCCCLACPAAAAWYALLLRLARLHLDDMPLGLGQLKNVTSLDLSSNRLFDLAAVVAAVSTLAELRELNLNANNLTGAVDPAPGSPFGALKTPTLRSCCRSIVTICLWPSSKSHP